MAAQEPKRPRIRVAALILIEGLVVLVRHAAGESRYHLLPGGGVDYRETLEDALVREVREETGLVIEVGNPVLISDTVDPDGPRHVVNITFMAEVVGGAIQQHSQDPRIASVDLVDPLSLIELDLRPPMAHALLDVVTGRGVGPARYLGSLFSPGR